MTRVWNEWTRNDVEDQLWSSLEDIATHRNADAWIRAVQRDFHYNVLRPMIRSAVDDLYTHGTLPLPPFNWGLREPWYLGDLS